VSVFPIRDHNPSGRVPYVTYTLIALHGGIMHLAGNMLFLWIFGDNLEDAFGHVGFLLFYLVGGLAADAGHVLSDADSQVPVVGASGAIAAVMGGYLLLYPKAKVDILLIFVVIFRVFTLPAWIVLMIWFGIQIVSGTLTGSEMGGVAYWAHAGGFVAGVVLALPPETKIPDRISNIPVVQRRRK